MFSHLQKSSAQKIVTSETVAVIMARVKIIDTSWYLSEAVVDHEKQTPPQRPLFEDMAALRFWGLFLQNMPIKIPDGFEK